MTFFDITEFNIREVSKLGKNNPDVIWDISI